MNNNTNLDVGYIGISLIAITLLETFFYNLFKVHGLYIIEAFLLIIIIMLNKSKRLFKSVWKEPSVVIWGVWCFYSLINWSFKGILRPDAGIPFYVFGYILLPWSIMALISYEGIKDINRTLVALLWILGIYVVGGILFQDKGTGVGTDLESRGGSELGNSLPLTAVVLMFVSYLSYIHKAISRRMLCFLAVSSLAAIFFVSTRKALGGWAIITVFYIIGKYNIKKTGNIIFLITFAVLFYFGYFYMMGNTQMGERMNDIEEVGLRYVDTDNSYLRFLGDRAFFYILGWDVFIEHPITGIGLTNFPIITNTPLVIHSEYMVQLCECGIIGTFVFVLFHISLIRLLWKARKRVKREILFLCWGGYLNLLFLGVTAWTYSVARNFVIYGLILACCRYERLINNKKNRFYFYRFNKFSKKFKITINQKKEI